MHGKPALAQCAEHAHGLDGFGVVQMAGGQLAGLLGVTASLSQGLVGQVFIEAGQPISSKAPAVASTPSHTLNRKITNR